MKNVVKSYLWTLLKGLTFVSIFFAYHIYTLANWTPTQSSLSIILITIGIVVIKSMKEEDLEAEEREEEKVFQLGLSIKKRICPIIFCLGSIIIPWKCQDILPTLINFYIVISLIYLDRSQRYSYLLFVFITYLKLAILIVIIPILIYWIFYT